MKFTEGFKSVFNSTQLGEMVAISLIVCLAIIAVGLFTAWGVNKSGLV